MPHPPVQIRRAIEVRPAAKMIAPTVTRSAGEAGDDDAGDATGSSVITGYAAVFGVVTELFRWEEDVFEEVVLPGAFTKSLARGDDVACVVEHDWGRVVARRSGKTLELAEDGIGLRVKASLPRTTEAMDLVENIRHGNIKGMSFRFYPVTDREEIFDRVEPDGTKVRVYKRFIMEADISDVSACVWPAYPSTTLELEGRGGEHRQSHTSGRANETLPEWVRAHCEKRAHDKADKASREIAALRTRVDLASMRARVQAGAETAAAMRG